MKNQLQIEHQYFSAPDEISVVLNHQPLYHGPADIGSIDFKPHEGENVLRVILDKKQQGNFQYDASTACVVKDSSILIKELIIENRYFRSLLTKCGLVEIDLRKNINFPSKYIDHENRLTMEGSIYLIKFQIPVKNWMQIHLNCRDLEKLAPINQQVKELLPLK